MDIVASGCVFGLDDLSLTTWIMEAPKTERKRTHDKRYKPGMVGLTLISVPDKPSRPGKVS